VNKAGCANCVSGDARGENSSLVVSMEINGVMYQGVLFAQVPARNAGRIST
jgi:hypothetical protein